MLQSVLRKVDYRLGEGPQLALSLGELTRYRYLLGQGELPPSMFKEILSSVAHPDIRKFADRIERFFDAVLFSDEPRSPSRPYADKGVFSVGQTPLMLLLEALERSPLHENDVFGDIGCQNGRVPAFVHLFTGVPCVGFEIDAAKAAEGQAIMNRNKLNGVTIAHQDGNTADLSKLTTIFMYEPCKPPLLDSLIEKLRVRSKQGPLTVWWLGYHHNWKDADWIQWEHIPMHGPRSGIAIGRSI